MTKKIYTLAELKTLHTTFKNMAGYTSSEFNYFVNKNMYAAEDELRPVDKMKKDMDESISEYTAALSEALIKYSKKDDKGQPLFTPLPNNQVRYELENVEEYKKEILEVEKKFSKQITKYESQVKEYNKLLEKTSSNFKPFGIKKELIPDTIPTEIYKVFFHLID